MSAVALPRVAYCRAHSLRWMLSFEAFDLEVGVVHHQHGLFGLWRLPERLFLAVFGISHTLAEWARSLQVRRRGKRFTILCEDHRDVFGKG